MLDRSLLRIQDLRDHRAIFISDIHGEKDLLEVLLEKVHYIPGQDTLFLLGDLIEKGSASLETLRWVMTLARNERVIVLKGNNDEAEQLLEDKIPLPMKLGYLRTRRSLISEMAFDRGVCRGICIPAGSAADRCRSGLCRSAFQSSGRSGFNK